MLSSKSDVVTIVYSDLRKLFLLWLLLLLQTWRFLNGIDVDKYNTPSDFVVFFF